MFLFPIFTDPFYPDYRLKYNTHKNNVTEKSMFSDFAFAVV